MKVWTIQDQQESECGTIHSYFFHLIEFAWNGQWTLKLKKSMNETSRSINIISSVPCNECFGGSPQEVALLMFINVDVNGTFTLISLFIDRNNSFLEKALWNGMSSLHYLVPAQKSCYWKSEKIIWSTYSHRNILLLWI